MKSIKPGRGPSKFSAFASICAAIFGVFWLIFACAMGGYVMIPFGIIFIVIAIGSVIYNLKNANSKNRYSVYDIVDSEEEPDMLNERFGNVKYCPYCGRRIDNDFKYCPNCGRETDSFDG